LLKLGKYNYYFLEKQKRRKKNEKREKGEGRKEKGA
jgi:hypothetical protein